MVDESREKYKTLVESFQEADKEFQEMKESLVSGEYLRNLVRLNLDEDELIHQHSIFLDQLQARLEERNVKLIEAQTAMRELVVMSETQWRGPDGEPSKFKYGGLTVNSKTSRSFDGDTLIRLAESHGILERVMELKKVDKDGNEVPIVQREWKVDFEAMKNWLSDNGLTDILEGAYDEKELTPSVKGPKPLTWLGEPKKS